LVISAVPDSPNADEFMTMSRVRLAIGSESGRVAVLQEMEMRDAAIAQLMKGKALKVGWDLKASRAALDTAEFELSGPDFDTKLAAYCLDPGAAKDPQAEGAEAVVLARTSVSLQREQMITRMKDIQVFDLSHSFLQQFCDYYLRNFLIIRNSDASF
jgi:DNA polymerase I-like protein with 3'-5' exonuclease and polymerase domains